MTYSKIIVNGDSYSAPYLYQSDPTARPVYSDFLQNSLGIPVDNLAMQGCSNDRIVRSTINHVAAMPDPSNLLVIINWSFPSRQETWYTGNNYNVIEKFTDGQFVSLEWIMELRDATPEQKYAMLYRDNDSHKQFVDYFTQIFLTANFLENYHIDYRFLDVFKIEIPGPCREFIETLHTYQWCINNPKLLRLNIRTWARLHDPECGESGHLSSCGHAQFAQHLVQNHISQ